MFLHLRRKSSEILLFLHPKHLQTAKPNLLLIKPALLQMLYEIRMIPLESSQQILDELAPAFLDLFKLFYYILIHVFLYLSLLIISNAASSCASLPAARLSIDVLTTI